MPLTRLSLAYAPVTELSALQQLPIKDLDLRGTLIPHLHRLPFKKTLEVLRLGKLSLSLIPLTKCVNLRMLIIPKGVYTQAELERLSIESIVFE